MKKEFIYISGKVTGLPRNKCIKKFKKTEEFLITLGFVPVNPMRHIPKGTEWSAAMRICLIELMKCQHIYMLRDWKNSNGAKIEHGLAIRLGFNILYEEIIINMDKFELAIN